MKNIIIIIGVFSLPFIGYGFWKLERKITYSFGYQDQVEKSIRSLVKSECLK